MQQPSIPQASAGRANAIAAIAVAKLEKARRRLVAQPALGLVAHNVNTNAFGFVREDFLGIAAKAQFQKR